MGVHVPPEGVGDAQELEYEIAGESAGKVVHGLGWHEPVGAESVPSEQV